MAKGSNSQSVISPTAIGGRKIQSLLSLISDVIAVRTKVFELYFVVVLELILQRV